MNKIVTQAIAAIAFGVKERTIYNWLKSWAAEARVYDTSISNALLVDIEKLYDLLCEKNSEKWQGYDYQSVIDAETTKVELPEMRRPEISEISNKSSQVNTVQHVNDREGRHEQIKPAAAQPPVDQNLKTERQLVEQMAEVVQKAVESVRVDHDTLVKTTSLAKKQSNEIREYQVNYEQLEKKNRRLNYYYIAAIILIFAGMSVFAWYLEDKSDNLQIEVNSAKSNIELQEEKLTNLETEKLQLTEKLSATIENEKEKRQLIEKASTAEKQLLEKELADIQAEKAKLELSLKDQIDQLNQQLLAADEENLLLRKQINEGTIAKDADGMEADPNGSDMDGK